MSAPGFKLGVAYYPEQWPRSRWRTDAEMMARAGLTLARIGEFAWSRLEPEPGRFDFDWLDESIAILNQAGIQVVLGTPTAAPPAWLVEQHPEILPIGRDGRRHMFGHRRHYCPNAPAFHDATQRIVGEIALRFGRDSRVIGWQVDNEFGGRCYCDTCWRSFQGWLAKKYGSLDNLNATWGTAFWSQTYWSWEQVPLPQGEPWDANPSLALDYFRFMSNSYVRYQAVQVAVLRSRSANQFITHNLMGFKFGEIDYGKLAADLDLVSWDNYPSLDPDGGRVHAALAADAMRGLKRRKVWVMEQQAGPVGWGQMLSPEPRQVRLWTYQAIAHGAEAVLFFRWRTARFGTEQHWHGILNADGSAGDRYRDLCRISSELRELWSLIEATAPAAEVAILQSYDSRFALQIQPTNPALGYETTLKQHYEPLRRLGLGIDVVADAAELDRYRIVVAPSLYIAGPEVADALSNYVRAGGTLVLAPRTAVKDHFNVTPEQPLPAWLRELCGVSVRNYQSVPAEKRVTVAGPALAGEFHGWFEELETHGVEALASYSDGVFAGSPAITQKHAGGGRVVYIAGAATQPTLDCLYASLASQLGLRALSLPEGVEAIRLEGLGDAELVVLLNHLETGQRLDFNGYRWRDHLSGASGEGPFDIVAYGVAFLERVRLATAESVS